LNNELHFEPIKQEAWYKQIKDRITNSKRLIDRMSIKEINQMYDQKKFLCDDCGKELEKADIPLEDHISHLINPFTIWSCEDCIIKCEKEGRIVGATEEPEPEQWQVDNI